MTGQQKRILAVDDSAMNHKIIGKTLGDNFALECAMSGRECLDRIVTYPIPDLILLDVTMPEMDGYEVCKRLRQDSRLQQVPILFLSGRCTVEEKLKGYEVGGDDYITKPFEAEELLIKIRKALDIRENVLRLSQRATTASRVAIKALKETSNIGMCLAFLETCFEAQTPDSIARMLFDTTKRLGWSASLQIQLGEHSQTYFDDGVVRELEVALLTKLRGNGEVDFGNRLVLELNNVSLLVKNVSPIGSEEREAIKELAGT
ncbi:MAG TPA: response regulator, partial [Pseudomonadales bacterium]|nr:response regulator [Pseudomonadales bacterium]